MGSKEYLGWCPVENTVVNRLKENSLVHTLSSKSHIRKSTKLINQELKKLTGTKTYSQYLKCKRKILDKITENTDVTDESDFSDDDYKKFYNSFEVSSKDQSKTNVVDEGFVWFYVEKHGRKKIDSQLDHQHLDNPHPHVWEPNIDISVIEDISNPVENPCKTSKQKNVNGLMNEQAKAKSCSPHKSDTKLNIKNVTSASTSKINNVGSKLKLKKETLVKEDKELQSFKAIKTVNKSPKDIKRNLTSVINGNGIIRKTPEASEGDDWNEDFVSSDFQAHSTQIFSDTLPDATNRGRKSVSRLRIPQNEIMNQPRDSGIEEDSKEENVSLDKKLSNSVQGATKKIQENPVRKRTEDLRNGVNNVGNNIVTNMRHKLPLKIIGEERLTTKYKIISNKNLNSITEEKQLSKLTIVEQKEEDSKKKSESSSDSEYVDTQNGDNIVKFKQVTEESSDEYYDVHDERNKTDSDDEKIIKNSKTITSLAKVDEGNVNKLSRGGDQLFTDKSSEENSVTGKISKKTTCDTKKKNKQIQKMIDHQNVKSDISTDNESIISNIVNIQSSPVSKRHNLGNESRKKLNKSSDREQSYEIEQQKDLIKIVQNYKKLHLTNKNTENDSKSIKIVGAKDNESEDSENSENEKTLIDCELLEKNKQEVPKQTHERPSQIEKLKSVSDEESSESEDDVKKDPPVKFILPDKKSDSEESEESEIDEISAVFQRKIHVNEEEGHLSIHAERRLAEMKRIDFANYDDSDDSDEEKNFLHIKNINAKSKSSKDLEDSDDSENPTQNASINKSKVHNKDSKSVEQSIIKDQGCDSEVEENVSDSTFKHLSQMKKENLPNSDNSSDDEEIKLENKNRELNNVNIQNMDVEENTMSLQEKQHLQKMKRLNFDNDSDDSNESTNQKVEADDDIDIEEHKVTVPEGYQESMLSKLMVEDSSSSSIMDKTNSGAEKTSKSKIKNKLSSEKVTGTSQEMNVGHYSSGNESLRDKNIPNKKSDTSEGDCDADMSPLSSKALTQINNSKKADSSEESDESDVEEPRKVLTLANKLTMKLANEDDDSDSDRSMSPSTTHRLSQYKKMNLIDKDSSSSSSEDEDNQKNDILPKKVENHYFKSDDSDEETSEELLKSNEKSESEHTVISEKNVLLKSKSLKLSIIDDSKESINTCPKEDNNKKRTAADKDKYKKNVVISETQESADIEENYVESQELFSSMEDLTEGKSEASVLECNDQNTANEVSATSEPTKIFKEKITNISQLVEKEKLLSTTYESIMTTNNFGLISPDENIYLLEVPKNVFNNNLIGEQFSFFKTTLRIGTNSYEAFKRKVAPTLSCVFQSEDHGRDSYKTINVRPVVSIVARRRKLVEEPDEPSHQEQQDVEDTEIKSNSTESGQFKTKKKKVKTQDATDSKKVKTSKKLCLSDITTELKKKNKTFKKKVNITNSPANTKKSQNNENLAHLSGESANKEILHKNENPREPPIKREKNEKTHKKEKLKGSPKKFSEIVETLDKENVADSITNNNKEKKISKGKNLIDSPTKMKKEGTNEKSKKNKFKISRFVQKPKKIKKVKETKVEESKLGQWKDNTNLKRTLFGICDDDSNSIDNENNASLSHPLKRQKTPIRDATNANEEDKEQVKLISKSKSKSKIKKVKEEVKHEKKSKDTKPKKSVAEDDNVLAEVSTSFSFSSKSKPVNKQIKTETKKSSKKRKSDTLLSMEDDPNTIINPTKKMKIKPAGGDKPKPTGKAVRAKMKKESAEVKNTLFSLFRKTMKCDSVPFFNTSNSNLDNGKYKPLELEHTSSKKSRLDLMSSSSDEDDRKCNFNTSFKMREKPKPELHNNSSNSSSDFIPSSQSAFKCEDAKKPKIFFNE